MPYVLHYDRPTGAIRGVWSAAERALLLAQMRDEEPTQGYLLLEDVDVSPGDLQERYEVVETQLRERQGYAIQATPPRFPADGTSPCVITVVPFMPSTLVIESRLQTWRMALERADDPLLLTADTPQVLTIRLEAQPGVWAPSLTVEAV
jgi:hypothetical protein